MKILLQKVDITSGTNNFFKRSIRFLYVTLLHPRSSDEDQRRHEWILNLVLVASIMLLFFLDCIVLVRTIEMGPAYHGIPFPLFSALLAAFTGLLVLSRTGHFLPASYVVITLFYTATTYGIYRWGTDLAPTLLMYALLIVMAGTLIGTRFGIAFASIVIISVSLCRYLIDAGMINVDTLWRLQPSGSLDAVGYCVFFFAIELIAWLSSKDIENSLDRARRSEKALKEKNGSLEEVVLERTKSLKQAQAEKISQLYRFAEFGKLSSGVFHDLMNPLSAVAANVSELGHSIHPDMKEIQEYIGRAVTASKKLEKFVSTVKKQISMSEYEEVFSVNEEIEEALTLLGHKAMKENIKLDWSASRKVTTYGNPARFQHVVNNLISNAIDSYAGFTSTRPRKVSIRLNEKKGLIELTIRDSGCGIAPEYQEKVFDPFFTTKPNHRGMGIGLSNTKEIISKDFNGTIRVKSAAGKGSTFAVIFPLAPPPHHETDSDPRSTPGHGETRP